MNEQQRRQIAQAERAQMILSDPMVQEALQTIEAAIRDQVFSLPIEAREQRDQLVMMDKIRQQFVRWFEIAINAGEVTKYELLAEQNAQAKLEAIREQARNYAG